MVTIYIAEEYIVMKTSNSKLTHVSHGNIDLTFYHAIKDTKDPNLEIVSWSNRYGMIMKTPLNPLEQEISLILSHKGVQFRKFTDAEWTMMKDEIKEIVFNQAVEKQRQKNREYIDNLDKK